MPLSGARRPASGRVQDGGRAWTVATMRGYGSWRRQEPTLGLLTWVFLLLLSASWLTAVSAMRSERIVELRRETVKMFYHGYDNYMQIAFPEDELRPVSCAPLTRDAQNPDNVALNDVLGNYSLTLIDSLSTLAILASAPAEDGDVGPKALRDFQDGVAAVVEQYGDGRAGRTGQGQRGRGFDVDSKVQVFETVIRGVGGLLSGHLFAVGELPIAGYEAAAWPTWPNGLQYDGQLLRLALDLATRLLPAFYTPTGMPYPRITETCSAGAGSLVLEFTVLSRLTGDRRFEQLAKRAFWAVWYRRSTIGLIGAGVDAEQGRWIGHYSVIGAGADSFFEYALKSHILLSGAELANGTQLQARPSSLRSGRSWLDPNAMFPQLSEEENRPEAFLEAWNLAHAAIKRHLYSDREHPHYVNVNLWTGSLASQWIDSLGAYYPGLLVLAGELEEAVETNLLHTAVWTRYAALPERWSIKDRTVEGGLGWWPLRPEFVESTYHIYRATRDPWYLYVGEMVQRDIWRRCWTACGWAGLQNVLDGEQTDRMESFFLGETAKYLYLLFDDRHPLNSLDAAYVFTTEGHPLILPRRRRDRTASTPKQADQQIPSTPVQSSATYSGTEIGQYDDSGFTNTCPVPPKPSPLTGSAITARTDIYHAARLLDLHLIGSSGLVDQDDGIEAVEQTHIRLNRSGSTFFPWTLPPAMLPSNGTCAKVVQPLEMSLEFASNPQESGGKGFGRGGGSAFNFMLSMPTLDRVAPDRIRVLTISGLKLIFRLDEELAERTWRITRVNGLPLGRDESILMDRALLSHISDARFNLVRDPIVVKLHHLHWDGGEEGEDGENGTADGDNRKEDGSGNVDNKEMAGERDGLATLMRSFWRQIVSSFDGRPHVTSSPGSRRGWSSISSSIGSSISSISSISSRSSANGARRPANILHNATGVTPTGLGAAPLPPVDVPAGAVMPATGPVPTQMLPWTTVFAGGSGCDGPLPETAARDHQILLLRRGGCSFSEKLANVPSFAPSRRSLQLVVVVSDDDDVIVTNPTGSGRGLQATFYDDAADFVRPLLDEAQLTPGGLPRRHQLAMVMVGGGEAAYRRLAEARQLGLTRRYAVESQGVRIRNVLIDDGDA
ncbi:er glycosyl hydrolase [Grosmannia clavigera kw1407]|uniref:alpha-1,2-Mannosidase n=1 Tax=Grosmannia clavigera (strain kw1407 / UAMH 11150) TaxID=655863 RepID=F0XDI2_GROCL|nr:er glycosyl hydrolase [Grosmannia clavigera kw1407]EFX03957.1 er glycosyl hydrolase [Grosmannia clavigera kw1407]